jgi:hypothetical protein
MSIRRLQDVISRRGILAIINKCWLVLTMTPLVDFAQGCCPNTYVTCSSGLYSECDDIGKFFPGTLTELTNYSTSVCELCADGCWRCMNQTITAITDCCDYYYGWNDDVCCRTYLCG